MTEQDTLLEFPCQFSIKAVGKNTPEIDTRIYSLVCRHVPGLDFAAVTTRPSKGDKYISVTVAFEATSKQQLDAIYMDLSGCDEVIMAL